MKGIRGREKGEGRRQSSTHTSTLSTKKRADRIYW
jgi:hypothetical protein